MKKTILSLAIALSSYCSYAQWSTGTGTIYPTVTTDKVGIGSNNPASPLSVTGSNLGSSPGHTAIFNSNLGNSSTIGNQINISNSSDWGLLFGFDGPGVPASFYHGPNTSYIINVKNGPLNFGTSNGVNMTLQTNGYLGLGKTSPNVPLHVAQTGNNVVGDMTLLSTFTDPTGIKGISLGYNQSSQAGIIYSENNTGVGSPLEFWTYNGNSFGARMVFTQAGYLGIGLTNPDAKLTVLGSGAVTNLSNGADQDLRFTLTAPGATDKYTLVSPSTNTNLAFGIGNAEKMRITASGNLLIGQATQSQLSL